MSNQPITKLKDGLISATIWKNQTENGKLMFIFQAFKAFKLWHGIEPEINSGTLKILNND